MSELTHPRVTGSIPGPRSRVLLDRQAERESNARTYPRRLTIAIGRAQGSYIEDVDGNVFIDFLTGAGVLALGHNHPEVVESVEKQLRVLCHGLDFPTELKDEFVSLQLSLLPEGMRDEMKIQFCGPAGANAVDAALTMIERIEAFNQNISQPLILKIGIHKGHSIAVTLNDRLDYFGQTVNIASRIQSLADANEIYVSSAVYNAPGVAETLKAHHVTPEQASVKGVSEKLQVYKIKVQK